MKVWVASVYGNLGEIEPRIAVFARREDAERQVYDWLREIFIDECDGDPDCVPPFDVSADRPFPFLDEDDQEIEYTSWSEFFLDQIDVCSLVWGSEELEVIGCDQDQ